MNATIILICVAALSVEASPNNDMNLERARIEFARAFPSYGSKGRAIFKGEIGFGISRIDVIAFNGDVARMGKYLFTAQSAAFFPDYYDMRMESRLARGDLEGDYDDDIRKFNTFIEQLSAFKHADIPAKVFVIKAFLDTVGLGDIVESASSLGAWSRLVHSDIASEIKPLSYRNSPNGQFLADFFTFSSGKELSEWSFKLDENAQILAVKRKLRQAWPIAH